MQKVVVITGGTSGYGLATAEKFKKEGYLVAIASRNAEKVEKVVAEHGFDAGYKLDVRDYEERLRVKDEIIGKFGAMDVLVNNAGGGVAGICLAYASLRSGAKTLLLNDRPVLGGWQQFGNTRVHKRNEKSAALSRNRKRGAGNRADLRFAAEIRSQILRRRAESVDF